LSAADGGVDDGASGAAVFRGEVVGLHAELLHGVRIELHHLVRKALIGRAVGVVVHAVDHEVVVGTAQAVHVEGGVAIADVGFADAGREQRQVGVGAAVQGQIDDGGMVNHLAAVAGVGLEHGGCRLHQHGFRHGAHVEAQIHDTCRCAGWETSSRRRSSWLWSAGLRFWCFQ
jgi:hypothetical protein